MWNAIIKYLQDNNITALPASGYVIIPKDFENRDTKEVVVQFEDSSTLIAELSPLVPEGYKVEMPEPTRRHPDECILIGTDTYITEYAFGQMK